MKVTFFEWLFNETINDEIEIRGEYWIIGNEVQFAEGDDNHQGIAIRHVYYNFEHEIQELLLHYGIEDDVREYGEINPASIERLINQVIEEVPESTVMEQLGANKEAFDILLGGGDARSYCMKYEGWIAVRSNSVELYGFNNSIKKKVGEGIQNIIYEEMDLADDEYDPENVYLDLYDNKARKSYNFTLAELLSQETNLASPVVQQTSTYNKSLPLPNDSTENTPQISKSKQSPTNINARKSGLIGPGQQLWRGTSESKIH